jgi:hypothetical protein
VRSGDTLYLAQTSCTRGGECLSELKSCPFEPGTSFNGSFELPVKTCTEVADTGDPTVMSSRSLEVFGTNFTVMYATEDVDFPGWRFKRGYNLVEALPMTPEGFRERTLCRNTAPLEVVADYNDANGTSFEPGDDLPEELLALVWERQRSCDEGRYRVIENPLGESLTITLGAGTLGAGG